jgi:hypothetical protein
LAIRRNEALRSISDVPQLGPGLRRGGMKAGAFEAEAGDTPFDGLPVQGCVLRLWKGGREVR